MSAPESPDTQKDATNDAPTWEQPPICGCAHETVTVTEPNRLTRLLAVLALAMVTPLYVAAASAWLTPEPEVQYVPSSGYTWAPENPTASRPVDSTTAKERKEFKKFLAQGKIDVLKWSTSRSFDRSASANVALSYLCMAESSKTGRYYAASKIDDDQDWGMEDGERLGNPYTTAREWCASTPSWAQAEGKPLPKPGQPEEP